VSELRRWKERRWRRDPRCAWCRVLTILNWRPPRDAPPGDPRRIPPLNLATVDHLRDRFDARRLEPARRGEVRRVLACRRCNERRARLREAAQPIEELRRRSGSPPGRRRDVDNGKEVAESELGRRLSDRPRRAEERRSEDAVPAR
jgi:hypothetical protein